MLNEWSRPTWAEVNLRSVAYNVRVLKQAAGQSRLMAVVKANGYGHGAIEVARTALTNGATSLGVATPEEGYELRKNGIVVPILILGAILPEQAQYVVDAGLSVTVSSIEVARALSSAATVRQRSISVHIKVDTGMGRIGVPSTSAPSFVAAVKQLPSIRIDGVYTHLSTADEDDQSYTTRQIDLFQQVVDKLKETGLKATFHAANSAAIMNCPAAHFDVVRAGIALYGLYPSPSPNLRSRVTLSPAISLKTRISQLRRLPMGSSVSYGRTYITSRDATIATIPIGYADGFKRGLSNNVEALVGGKRFPVVGNICMDQSMLDLGDYEAQVGDEVVLLGGQGSEFISVDEWASSLGTINYEIITSIGPRVPRAYIY